MLVPALVLAGPGREATAAEYPAAGAQVYGDRAQRSLAITCETSVCDAAVQVTVTCGTDCDVVNFDWRVRRSAVQPPYQGGTGGLVELAGPMPTPETVGPPATSYAGGVLSYPLADLGTGAWLSLTAYGKGGLTGYNYLVSVWEFSGAPSTPAPTTAPPTSSPEPTSTTGPEPTATTPPPTPSEPTTTPGSEPTPTPGTGGPAPALSCTTQAPCIVRVIDGVTVDVGSLEVAALTSEQWAVIETTAAVLVFFAAASFWTTMRRRGA